MRGKLTHGELDDHHRDRENERSQAHHGCGDGREDVCIRTADEAGRKRLVIEVAIEGDRPERRAAPASTSLVRLMQLPGPSLPSERAAEPQRTVTH